jgi:predicted metal-dependent hydrolase
MKVKVIRSRKRVRTISALPEGNVLVVRAPMHVSKRQLDPIIRDLRERWMRVRKPKVDDASLNRRAQVLNRIYFNGQLTWKSLKWVNNMTERHASCTPEYRTIRISSDVAKMPKFVQDYILVHELAHLIEDNHGPRFWKLCARYPLTERARGYLMATDATEN